MKKIQQRQAYNVRLYKYPDGSFSFGFVQRCDIKDKNYIWVLASKKDENELKKVFETATKES